MLVGVISDTHGLLRPEAIAALSGSDLIVHAGDIGRREVIERLRDLAPTYAVRGNIDIQPWARKLPVTAVVRAGRHRLLVLHDISQLAVDPVCAGTVPSCSVIRIAPRPRVGTGYCYSILAAPVRAGSAYQSRWRGSR